MVQGGCLPGPGGEPAWSGGVPAWSGGGACLVPGGGIPSCTEADTSPVNSITDACENITLPQLRCGR